MPALSIAELTELAARALKRAGASKTMAECSRLRANAHKVAAE